MFERTDHDLRSQLMVRAQNGDSEAFRELLKDIGPSIMNFLRRRVADRDELEDVCQETLIAIYESRHTYEPSLPLEPWIFAIARHVGARHFRSQLLRASWQELVDGIPEGIADNTGNCLVKLRQALSRLSRFQREAFMMTKIEGLSLAEASARTGASVGTMKVRVHRAHEFLKRCMLG